MPHSIHQTYKWLSYALPQFSDLILGVGGLVLSWGKTADRFEHRRKHIGWICFFLGFASFGFRIAQQIQADNDTQTLVNNTNTLVSTVQPVLTNTNTLVGGMNNLLGIA
jgi:hypothetical protein